MHPKKILHPTDCAEVSAPALREALQLAEEHGADLVLLHVVETLGPENLTFGEMQAPAPQPASYRERLWAELRHVVGPRPTVHVEYVLSEEQVVTAILRTAMEFGCDLIVMGTHGVTGWRRWVTGSVAEEVVRRAGCPVLVVKPPREPEPLPEVTPDQIHPGHLTRSGD